MSNRRDAFAYYVYQHIVCMDGFTLSVQAGVNLASEPKESAFDEQGFIKKGFGYKSVEIQMKGGVEPLFDDYISKGCRNCGGEEQGYEEYSEPLSYVPVELLVEVIKKHGGVIQGQIPPFHKEWQDKFEDMVEDEEWYNINKED